jgi:hypothetical protein
MGICARARVSGLVVRFLLRVQEVGSSILPIPLFTIIYIVFARASSLRGDEEREGFVAAEGALLGLMLVMPIHRYRATSGIRLRCVWGGHLV